jgi:MtaA/CmuA family methyltransferase
MSEFLLDIALNEKPDEIQHLLDFCRQVSYRYAVAQIEQGAHATSIGDSPSGPDVISPKYYHQYAYPQVKKLVNDLKSENILLAYHICGNSTPIIKEMVDTGAAILEIDQKADMQKSKAAAAGKATLLGPVDPSDVMASATAEVVVEKCREAIEILAPGGGFILGPGCALPGSTPDENIHAMIETAKEFGNYAAS